MYLIRFCLSLVFRKHVICRVDYFTLDFKMISNLFPGMSSPETPPALQFICIECEHPASKLFSVYEKSGNIKVEKCPRCNKVIDKYIEYDVTICLLDLLLLNTSVWRHVIFNVNFNSLLWKLAIVGMICDGYKAWIELTSLNTKDEDTVFYAAKQIELYIFSVIAGSQLLVFLLLVLLITEFVFALRKWLPMEIVSYQFRTPRRIVQSLLIANCTKLLYVPAIIWPHYSNHAFMLLLMTYVKICYALALQQIVKYPYLLCLFTVFIAHTASGVINSPLSTLIQSLSSYAFYSA